MLRTRNFHTLYELCDFVKETNIDVYSEDVGHKSYVKDEEFNKIVNSLPLDKILMNKIIKCLF